MLGVILCPALIFCSRNFGDRGGTYFLVSAALAGILYLFAIREFFVTPRFPQHVIVLGLLLAAVWNVAFLRVPAGADDDIHRYVWDGRLQHLGYNPYIVVPNDPAVQALHTSETRNLNHPDLPSPYPAGAQLFFRAVTAVQESTLAFKVAFAICELAIIFVLLDVLGREQRAHWVLAFAWNPLLAIEVAGSGHIDIVGALFLLLSGAALGRRWFTLAAVAFGLAVSVKLLPIVLLPLYWKRVRIRDAALAIGVVGLLYLPFLKQGLSPVGSLGTYVQSFRFNGPFFGALERVAPPMFIAGMALLVGFVTAIWMRRSSTECSPAAFAWPMAASLLCAPVVYPWYLLSLIPFLRSFSTLPLMIWTVSITATYMVWHLRALGRPWIIPDWAMLLEYGCVAVAGALIALRQLKSSATPKAASAVRNL